MQEYDQLTLRPEIVAKVVLGEKFTGHGITMFSCVIPSEIERARNEISNEQAEEFVRLVDRRCRTCWEVQAEWFTKCVRSKTGAGRDRLYDVIRHWLSAYLKDPVAFAATGRAYLSNPIPKESHGLAEVS